MDVARSSRADDAGGTVSAGLAGVLARARMSMSGAQKKLVLYRRPQTGTEPPGVAPEYRLPVAGSPSTVLVKRARSRFPGLLQNELACMAMMASAGVPTAEHTVCALDADVYETARFDRVCRADGSVLRLHADDGCQLTGRTSAAKYAQTGSPKYAQTGGPTYADLTAALRRYGTDPGTDTPLLFRWAVANLARGNRDAHAKNVSVLRTVDGAVRFAPAYDSGVHDGLHGPEHRAAAALCRSVAPYATRSDGTQKGGPFLRDYAGLAEGARGRCLRPTESESRPRARGCGARGWPS